MGGYQNDGLFLDPYYNTAPNILVRVPKKGTSFLTTTHTLRVQVPNILLRGILVIVIIVQVLGKYMTIRY